ncbi:MAG: anthranilate synthase component I, partial [Paenibacillus sp.]|nr:anthranilate synthase component I [Paenibacillus sp.]
MKSILSQLTYHPDEQTYTTQGQVEIIRVITPLDEVAAVNDILEQIDSARGALYSSSYEYPGRYSRWDMGFVHPPIQLRTVGNRFYMEALNARGEAMIPLLLEA